MGNTGRPVSHSLSAKSVEQQKAFGELLNVHYMLTTGQHEVKEPTYYPTLPEAKTRANLLASGGAVDYAKVTNEHNKTLYTITKTRAAKQNQDGWEKDMKKGDVFMFYYPHHGKVLKGRGRIIAMTKDDILIKLLSHDVVDWKKSTMVKEERDTIEVPRLKNSAWSLNYRLAYREEDRGTENL